MKPKTFWLMAIICGFAVANLYYNQPILAEIAKSFDATAAEVGWIPTLTQMGYASGLLLFVPLGDRLERRSLIVIMLLITAVTLFIAALSPNLNILILASYGIGAATIAAQIILPFATDLVEESIQGKIIGNLMSALFVGILLARPLGGWLGQEFGWRSIYWLAGGVMVILALASTQLLPKNQPKSKLSYGQLLRSLWELVKSYSALRSASLIQAMLFGAFSVFWSTLVFLLTRPPYNYGSNAVGLFGLVGIAGIIAAPLLGQMADKGTAKTLRSMVNTAVIISIFAYLIFWQFSTQLGGLIIGSVLLNLGSQGALVANQVKIYSLDRNARSRLNTVFMVATFLGASLGSVLGTYGWSIGQWSGVCVAGLLLIGVAALDFSFKQKHNLFMTNLKLLSPASLGELKLNNRLILAPLTRCRAGDGYVPQAINALYYAQRASAGLIISEATQVARNGIGYPNTPGIYSQEQVEGWKQVTQAVYNKGGKIFLQLWHAGRVAHPSFLEPGELPIAPSPIAADEMADTAEGQKPHVIPREIELDEIPDIIAQFQRGAKNALEAGFDGVEIHSANGYLLDQFLQDNSNQREDEYGGSLAGRSRFLLEVTQAVVDVWGKERVGVRLSPGSAFNDMHDSNPTATFSYVVRELSRLSIGYLHIVEPRIKGNVTIEDDGKSLGAKFFRPMFQGAIITAGGYNRDTGEAILQDNHADFVAYGRLFLANPDLPKRFALNASLNQYDRDTFYTSGEKGYTDYPILVNS